VEIYAHEEDIRRYLESGLRGVRLIKAKPEIKTEIISTIIEAAEGM
jgi:hypothetical protein